MQSGSEIPPDVDSESTHPQVAPERKRMGSVVRRASTGAILLIAIVALSLNRPIARSALLIGLLSVSLAYVIAPLAGRLRLPFRRGREPIGPAWTVLAVYLVLFVSGALAWIATAGTLQRQMEALRAQLPFYAERARQRLETVEKIADRFPYPEPMAVQVRTLWRTVLESVKTYAARVIDEIRASRPLLSWLWLAPVISLLLISRVAWFRNSAVARLPEGHLRWRGEEFFGHVNSVLAGYMRAQLWSFLIISGMSIAGFSLTGVPYALLLGTIAGLLEFLPVVGPLSAAFAACMLVNGERLLILLAFLVAMRLVQDYLIYPLLVSRGMHLHPAAIILAIFAGAHLGGMLGVLVAIPFVGIASVAVRHWREYWEIEKLVRRHAQQQAEAAGRETMGIATGAASAGEGTIANGAVLQAKDAEDGPV
jgi:predicted PurR-regulated permease PerM